MRWLVGFVLLLLALGTLRVVGCGEPPEGVQRCETTEECDDQNECTRDECTGHGSAGRFCDHLSEDGQECDFDGVDEFDEDGICVSGVCEKNPCDDGNECTEDWLSGDGCENRAFPSGWGPCDWNGEPGVCMGGVCAEDLCKSVCDDGDHCTIGGCDRATGVCTFRPVQCPEWHCRYQGSCDPDTGMCVFTFKPDSVDCCNGIYCPDPNPCTRDFCDLDSRRCVHAPDFDGERCCLRRERRCGIYPGSSCGWVCVDWGSCNSGVCG